MSRAIFSPRGTGREIRNPLGGPIEFKALLDETDGAVTAFESAAAAGEGPPFHVHEEQDEIVYFIDGPFRFRSGDEVSDAPAGSFVFIPRGTEHTWQNLSDSEARLFVVFIPGAPGMERFFEAFAEAAAEGGTPAMFAEIAEESGGMRVLGPPLAISHPLD